VTVSTSVTAREIAVTKDSGADVVLNATAEVLLLDVSFTVAPACPCDIGEPVAAGARRKLALHVATSRP